MFSKDVTTLDEVSALFVMSDYNKIPTKDKKKDKLVGEDLRM